MKVLKSIFCLPRRVVSSHALTMPSLTGIGEALRQQYEELAEDKRQRTIRSVEEVVRRDEEAKTDKKLSLAKSDWLKERQQLFQEAHQNQLRAIARQNTILETKLRKEFAETLEKTAQEHREHLTREIASTWTQAEAVKREAVERAREEEREGARLEACQVADRVAEEMRENAAMAEEEKQRALSEQHEQLMVEQSRALEVQRQELEERFQDKLSSVCEEYEQKLAEVDAQLEEQQAVCRELENKLGAMTELKENWETKYSNLRAEFSDFIDHVPGFRGEFVLK